MPGGLHHLAAYGHSGHARRVVKLAHDEQVRPAVERLQGLDVAVERVDLRFERLHAALQVVDRIPQVVVVVARLERGSQRDEEQDQILFHNVYRILLFISVN